MLPPFLYPLTSIDPTVNDGNPASRRNTQHVRNRPASLPSFTTTLCASRFPNNSEPAYYELYPLYFVRAHLIHSAWVFRIACKQRRSTLLLLLNTTLFNTSSDRGIYSGAAVAARCVPRLPVILLHHPEICICWLRRACSAFFKIFYVRSFHELHPLAMPGRTLPTRRSENIRASFDLNPSTYLIPLHASVHATTRTRTCLSTDTRPSDVQIARLMRRSLVSPGEIPSPVSVPT
jgi:hypothetical protein